MPRTAVAGLLLLLLLAACQIDVSGSSSFTESQFTPDEPNPGPRSVSLQPFFGDDSIGFRVDDIDDLSEIAYTLTWNPEVIGYHDIPFDFGYLGEPGQVSELTVTEVTPGRLEVRHRRLDRPNGVSGSGIAHVLDFRPCDGCRGVTGAFVEDLVLSRPDGSTIEGVRVHHGQFTVVRH